MKVFLIVSLLFFSIGAHSAQVGDLFKLKKEVGSHPFSPEQGKFAVGSEVKLYKISHVKQGESIIATDYYFQKKSNDKMYFVIGAVDVAGIDEWIAENLAAK